MYEKNSSTFPETFEKVRFSFGWIFRECKATTRQKQKIRKNAKNYIYSSEFLNVNENVWLLTIII